MPSLCSRALVALAATVGSVPECSGAMLAVFEDYSAANCAAAELKSHVFFKEAGKCEVLGNMGVVYSCSGAVLSMKVYNNDVKCEMAVTTTATFEGATKCIPNDGKWKKGYCVDASTLWTWNHFGAEGCAASDKSYSSYFPACISDGVLDPATNTWSRSSFGTVLSSDGTQLIRTSYDSTVDCTGSTTGSGTYTCGACLDQGGGTWWKFTCPAYAEYTNTSTSAALHIVSMMLSMLAAVGLATV